MSGIIPKRIIEEIRFRNDIADVIGSYITLKKSGSTFKALCPFHKEKTPSFNVNLQRQIWHCFGCGEGGDVFGFIMKQEGVDFITAIKMLADRSGIQLEMEEDSSAGQNKNILFRINQDAASFYHRNLIKSKGAENARKYLKSRHIDKDTIEKFLIGYAPDRWDAVIKGATRKKYSLDQLETAGLVLHKETESGKPGKYYDRFRNRVIFPIHDEQDRVVGFSARILDKQAKSAKYVNTPETPLFKKSRILYGLNKARREIVDKREAIICEGQLDVIRCHQSGFPNTIAAQGTAFTEDQVRALKRYADSVVVVFDQDIAGQNAAIKTARLFMKAGLAVRVAMLPEGQDPDSFLVKEGADAFKTVIEKAPSAVAYQINILSCREKADTEVGLMRIARHVLETINHSPNSIQRARLVQEAAGSLNVPPSALSDELAHISKKNYKSQKKQTEKKKQNFPPDEISVCECLAHIYDYPEMEQLVRENLPLNMFSHELCRFVAKTCLDAANEGRQVHEVFSTMDNPPDGVREMFSYLLMQPTKVRGNDKSIIDAVKDGILAMWRKKLKEERKALKEGSERRTQITMDLKALAEWETGSPIIEMELQE